jgi:class 3 adenylate cyclase/tetratricopeptide (TPR) repeat protein
VATPVTGTFLFTDLVDSTAIASRLGPDAAEELRLAHFAVLRSSATGTGGIEVKSTGDGLMLMFTSPSRALSCAVAIQQGVDRHNQRSAEPLSVRIGLSMGEATEDEGDYYGDCVVEAARLCAAADGGQILTTELLRAVVGRHATQEFASIGALELKGLPDAVPAVEVRWVAESIEGSVPLPGRFVGPAAEGLFGFFGRGDELELLLAASKRATSEGRTEVVFLAGEPGIGKTTLAAQVSRALHGEGATVLFGHCVEELAIPYQPWVESLSHLLEHAPGDLLERCLERHGATLARLVPVLARRTDTIPAAGDAEGDRFVLLEAITDILRTAGAESPVVLVVDDLQWADAASLQLLRHVVTAAPSPAMLVIGTYRDSDVARDHPLTSFLADMRREPNVARVALRGLDDDEILALMEGAAGYEMQDDGIALAHAVYEETDGNPFFTGELLRHLYETGAIALDESGQYVLTIDLDEVGLPGSVREVVRRRVDRLGEETTRALSVASVVGREFDLEVISAVAEIDEDVLLELLEAATGAALVVELPTTAGRFRFDHALIQHTLYQDLSATRRQRLHQRIAQVLEELAGAHAPPVAELARHWLAATRPADVGKAIEYARLAGEAAIAALAPEDAIRWYSQALELQERQAADDVEARCDLLIGLGDAQQRAGVPAHRETLLEASALADRLDDADRLVRSALANTRGTITMDVDLDRIRVLEAALARVDRNTAIGARLLVALANEIDPDEWERARDLALEAVSVARQSGDDATLLTVLNGTGTTLGQPDRIDERLARTEEAIELADRLGDRAASFQARYEHRHVLMELLRVEEADALREDLLRRAGELGLPFLRWQAEIIVGSREMDRGLLETAESHVEATMTLGTRTGIVEALATYGGQLHDIRLMQGRRREIAPLFIEAAIANPTIPSLRTAAIGLCFEVGDLAEARRRYDDEVASGFSYPRAAQWLGAMDGAVDGCVMLGDSAGAATLYERLLPYADRAIYQIATSTRPLAGLLARLATQLGRFDEAEEHFEKAVGYGERLQAVYWTMRTLLDHADLCVARGAPGDDERARELATRARDTSREFGFAGLEARADAMLSPA